MSKKTRSSGIRTLRRDAFARRVILAWRRLTCDTEARTVVACSGGGDSVALSVALASAAPESIILGHCTHSMRSEEEARADRDFVMELADRLRVGFMEGAVGREVGNPEGTARRGRYALLEEMARGAGARWVATGHTADDQFETVLMALVRGAGPDGMRGAARRRHLGEGVSVCRPMLGVGRAQARVFLERAGIGWHEDRTNDDTTRLRSAIRHGPLAVIEEIRPGASTRAARSAALVAQSALVVQDRVEEVFGDDDSWSRKMLRGERVIVIGAGLRRAALRLTGGVGADRMGSNAVRSCIRAICDDSTEPRRFEWGGGVVVEVTAREVRVLRMMR